MSDLQKFKRNEIQPKVKEIDELLVEDKLKRSMKRQLFKTIISGKSELISKEDYQQLRKQHVESIGFNKEQEERVTIAYAKAKEAWYKGNRRDFKEKLFWGHKKQLKGTTFEDLNLLRGLK